MTGSVWQTWTAEYSFIYFLNFKWFPCTCCLAWKILFTFCVDRSVRGCLFTVLFCLRWFEEVAELLKVALRVTETKSPVGIKDGNHVNTRFLVKIMIKLRSFWIEDDVQGTRNSQLLNFGVQGQKIQIWGIHKFRSWSDKLHPILKSTNIWWKTCINEMHSIGVEAFIFLILWKFLHGFQMHQNNQECYA